MKRQLFTVLVCMTVFAVTSCGEKKGKDKFEERIENVMDDAKDQIEDKADEVGETLDKAKNKIEKTKKKLDEAARD